MRRSSLVALTVVSALVSAAANAATVWWRAGESPPPTEIVPQSPNDLDTVSFTVAFTSYFGSPTFSNACEAGKRLGYPTISTDAAAHAFKVEFSQADPTTYCLFVWAPVNGIEGELGQLEPGPWTLTVINSNIAFQLTLPFTVRLASDASAKLILHTHANDQTTGTRFPFDRPFFIARPLGARCNPGHGGASCGTATLEHGVPLWGTAAVDIGSAGSFTLPREVIKGTATGSLPVYSPYAYISTAARDLRNGTGFFKPGGGPGKRTFTVSGGSGPGARIAVTPGTNQFGGTLGILGAISSKRAHVHNHKTYVGSYDFFNTVFGRSCTGTGCLLPTSQPTATIYMKYRTAMGKATTVYMTPWGLPWTTGVVSISATEGPFPTRFRRSGYDNRTANGLGTIQMVAPHLVRWDFLNRKQPWDRHTGTIGILRIRFVPEPSGWAMLAAGAASIALFGRRRRRGGAARR
jgi:hypothetical protein